MKRLVSIAGHAGLLTYIYHLSPFCHMDACFCPIFNGVLMHTKDDFPLLFSIPMFMRPKPTDSILHSSLL